MIEYSEKRDFLRMPLDCELDYQLEGDSERHRGQVRNLSAGGLLFVAPQELATDQRLLVTLTPVNTITPPMSANARVLRCDEVETESDGERSWLIACEIEQID